MNFKNPQSFNSKIKNIARTKRVNVQQVRQHYYIELFLRKLSKTKYRENFIIKGGYLISNIVGISERTTMDLDTTLKRMAIQEEKILA